MWLDLRGFGQLENASVGLKGVRKVFGVGLVLVKGGWWVPGSESEKAEI